MIGLKTILFLATAPLISAFIAPVHHAIPSITRLSTQRQMAEGEKLAKQVTGEELEKMLQEWGEIIIHHICINAYGRFIVIF